MGTLFPLNSLAQGNSERVTIRGQVLVDDAMGNSNLEVVEVDNLVCVPLSMHPNGRFELVSATYTPLEKATSPRRSWWTHTMRTLPGKR